MAQRKIILITGTSSGFGRLSSIALAKKGHRVWATMRGVEGKNREKAKELKNAVSGAPGSVEVLELDVTGDDSVRNAVEHIKKTDGRIDALVNNAGAGSMGLLEDFTMEMLKRLYELNVFGVFRVTKAVLPIMKSQRDGLVVNISSGLGRICLPTYTYYNSTKWALEALSQSWRYELNPLGIDCVIVEPGAYPTTDFIANMGAYSVDGSSKAGQYGDLFNMHKNFRAMVEKQIKDGTVNNPQRVADAIAALVDAPKGERPVRTVVDPLFESLLAPYNKMLDDLQGGLLNNFGIGSLLKPAQ
jgi:NAD(P)-dependent dehydrogenase (short-subunit alcohol dehydrogenase family)